jgi:uncharacterized protein (TIGR02996 family)
MTSDGEALFRAICEQPWENTPRLAYADWLEENGDPQRAAFIRFECEFPVLTPSHPRYHELMNQSGQFDAFCEQWESELPQFKGVKWSGFFDRGFAHWVTFRSSKAFLDHADAVFATAPVDFLEARQLTDNTIARVLASPYVRRLNNLILRGNYRNEGVRKIAACPELPRLESLCVWGGGCSNAGAEALAASSRFPALRCLSFSNHKLTDRGALAIAESSSLRSVKRLVLHGTGGLSGNVVRRLKERFEEVK